MTSEAILTVRVTPRSSRNRHELLDDGTLRIWLTAAPVEGAANKAVVSYLADLLGCSQGGIQIVLGQSNRTKRVRVPLAIADVLTRLENGQN